MKAKGMKIQERKDSLPPIERLSRELRDKSAQLRSDEAGFLVDAYYRMQEYRIRANQQLAALGNGKAAASEEEEGVLPWFARQSGVLERQIAVALDRFSGAHPIGVWMRNIKGIGPILSAGFLAHIDITKAPTAGHIWRFAGLDPTVEWKKGNKRPWNAELKTLCWKTGESFVKVSGGDDPGYYGVVYAHRKAWEIEQNEKGLYADQAAHALERKKWRDDTVAKAIYLTGKLPPAHLHSRAKRYAVKLFLSHLHHRWFEHHYGKPPPMPYAITQLGHGHYVPPPE